MEKHITKEAPEPEESDLLMMKVRLEEIMTTFQEERWRTEQEQRGKVERREREIK